MPREPDPKAPEAQVSIRDFGGFTPNADPHDITPGSSIRQLNTQSVRPGELRGRTGCKVVQFD
jgi:hypothetical protein